MKKKSAASLGLILALSFVASRCGNMGDSSTTQNGGSESTAENSPGPIDGHWKLISTSCGGVIQSFKGNMIVNHEKGEASYLVSNNCVATSEIKFVYPNDNQISMEYVSPRYTPEGCSNAPMVFSFYTYNFTVNKNNLFINSTNDPSCPGDNYIATFEKRSPRYISRDPDYTRKLFKEASESTSR